MAQCRNALRYVGLYMVSPTLRSKKSVFVRPSLSCQSFQWLGNGSYAGGTKTVTGRLLTQVRRDPNRSGMFNVVAGAVRSQASNGTTVPLIVKEAVCDHLYRKPGSFWDIDIRTQLCSRVDDPHNWDMIKRICYASALDESVDQESAYSPSSEGEVIHTLNMASPYPHSMIYGVESREFDLTDIYGLTQHFYFGSEDLWPHIDVRYGDEWVISVGSSNDYGVMWGYDISNMDMGRLNMDAPIAYLSAEDRVVVAADIFGSIWISHDNGNNFIMQHDSASLGIGEFRALLVESFASVWLTTDDARVYRSFDGGKTLNQQIALYSVPNYEMTDITKSDPNNVYFFSDITDMGISQTDEDVVQRVIESATEIVSLPPNIVHADGILFIGGKDDSNRPILKMSLDGGHSWMYSMRMSMATVVNDDYIVVMPASGGCGVVWLVMVYVDAVNDLHCDIYRSVYYGLPTTWVLEWSQVVDLGGATAFGFMPTDVVAMSPNHCVVVGLQIDYLDPTFVPSLYAVELYSCED